MDVATLFFVEGSLLLLFAATMLIDWVSAPADDGRLWFAASNFFGAIGMMLRPWFLSHLPLTRYTFITNAFFFLELCLLVRSIASFVQRGKWLWFPLLALSAVMLWLEAWFLTHGGTNVQVVYTLSTVLITTTGSAAVLLLRYCPPGIRSSANTTAALLIAYALDNVLRTFTVFYFPGYSFFHIWADRTILCGLSVAFFLMANAQLRYRLVQQAMVDPLTGVLNRRALDQVAARVLEQNRRGHHTVAVLMLDVDAFKEINDRFGHEAGDRALQALANCLKETMRQADLIVRMGGDEFLVLLPETSFAEAREAAARLRQTMASLTIETRKGSLQLSASIGIAALEGQNLTLNSLLSQSDRDLYAMKAQRSKGTIFRDQAAT